MSPTSKSLRGSSACGEGEIHNMYIIGHLELKMIYNMKLTVYTFGNRFIKLTCCAPWSSQVWSRKTDRGRGKRERREPTGICT